jgi:hypothetical protein
LNSAAASLKDVSSKINLPRCQAVTLSIEGGSVFSVASGANRRRSPGFSSFNPAIGSPGNLSGQEIGSIATRPSTYALASELNTSLQDLFAGAAKRQ